MRIGILGAGQLGRMLALSGYPLGLSFVFLDPAEEACAAALGDHQRAAYNDDNALEKFCANCDVATFEFENVPAQAADYVSQHVPMFPAPNALLAGQDRLDEKRMFDKLNIPVPRYMPVAAREALNIAAKNVGLPAVLKTRRMGYDGKGQAVLRSEQDLDQAWDRLSGQALIMEAFVKFQREISCISVRSANGEMAFYPVVENVHRDGILRVSTPRANDPLQAQAEAHARKVAEHLNYVGVLAFEFFVADGELLANEIAPRVHNSGHWTIEGAETSQFENHLRAIAGLPLGSTALRGASCMYNLIGDAIETQQIVAVPGAHLHDYGKTPKPKRKVGHVTVTASDEAELIQRCEQLEKRIEHEH